ncbi:hypothetical protein EX30DRAFT_337797, partial [Ascodesmis nigricans]
MSSPPSSLSLTSLTTTFPISPHFPPNSAHNPLNQPNQPKPLHPPPNPNLRNPFPPSVPRACVSEEWVVKVKGEKEKDEMFKKDVEKKKDGTLKVRKDGVKEKNEKGKDEVRKKDIQKKVPERNQRC